MNPSNTKLKIGLITGVIVVLGAIVAIFKGGAVPNSSVTTLPTVDNSNTVPIAQTSTGDNSQNTPTPPATPPVAITSTYKDGTYSADGSYNSPGGPDSISVTLTLKNDIVTDTNVVPNPGDRTSARYQNMFVSGYKQYVIGKDITSLNLGKISGSSLTPIGFDNALAKIKAQAKA
jgi:uncharacterized protein with FMN-binding domain